MEGTTNSDKAERLISHIQFRIKGRLRNLWKKLKKKGGKCLQRKANVRD